MNSKILRKIIREEVKNILSEQVTGKYAVKGEIANENTKIEMLEDDVNKVAIIKMNGTTIAKYKYDDSGVVKATQIDAEKMCDALAFCVFKFDS